MIKQVLLLSLVMLCLMPVLGLAQENQNEMLRGGHTPLHIAAWKGDVLQIQTLIAGGADVNSASSFGTTPLHSAAVGNRQQAVKALLQQGARVDARDGLGRTPLFAALEVGASRAVIEALLEAGAAVNIKDDRGKTSIDVAWTDEIKALLRQHLAG